MAHVYRPRDFIVLNDRRALPARTKEKTEFTRSRF